MAVPNSRELFEAYNSGRVIYGDTHPIHDYNNAAYQRYFSLGRHKIGGASGTVFNAYGVHLDGGTVTEGSSLDNVLNTWFLKDTFAPGSPKVMKDAKGRLLRAIDATGGQAPTIGGLLEDQFQGHWHEFNTRVEYNTTAGSDIVHRQGTKNTLDQNTVIGAITDGTHGTPRTGSTTRDKSLTVGVPYMVIMVAV